MDNIEIDGIACKLEIIWPKINFSDSKFIAMRLYSDNIDITIPRIGSMLRTKEILVQLFKEAINEKDYKR